MQELWVSTNEAEDVASSIRHTVCCIDLIDDDPQAWKWVILALHAALQGACVCHLTTTAAPVGAVTKKNAIEWLAYFDEARTDQNAIVPKTHLMNLPDLLKAVRKPNSCGGISGGACIPITDAELAWLSRIHDEFRNQFIHFSPVGWSFEVSGMPKIMQLIARIITDISEYGWAFRHLGEVQLKDMAINLDRLAKVALPH